MHANEKRLQVIINGYPKSGTTWICRLVADVIGCPVAGYWKSPAHAELAVDGSERNSPHKVWKSHHVAHHLANPKSNRKIIYVIRDPRDIATSGAHYFNIQRYRHNMPGGSSHDPFEAMVNVLINGGPYPSCGQSWGNHITDFERYFECGHPGLALAVKYESILREPEKELVRILNFLGLSRSSNQAAESCRNQSFDTLKRSEQLKEAGGRPKFFRKGQSSSFLDELGGYLALQLENVYSELLHKYGYKLTGGKGLLSRSIHQLTPKKLADPQDGTSDLELLIKLSNIATNNFLMAFRNHPPAAFVVSLSSPSNATFQEVASGKPFFLSRGHNNFPSEGLVSSALMFFFHTAIGKFQSITIDLGESRTLAWVKIANRTDKLQSRARCLYYALHDTIEYSCMDSLSISVTSDFLRGSGAQSITMVPGLSGRYFTIFSPIYTALHFSSLELWAHRNHDESPVQGQS